MKKLIETNNKTFINELVKEYDEEEIEEIKQDYGESFDKSLFDDSDLSDIDPNEKLDTKIKLSEEEIVECENILKELDD